MYFTTSICTIVRYRSSFPMHQFYSVRYKTSSSHLTHFPFRITSPTDNADACLWVLPDVSCAIGSLCDEHNVVHEDLKRCEENTGKISMMDDLTPSRS